MFTERQLELIKKAKALNYGYRSFAMSVEDQGWCSPKQEDTLCKLISDGTYRKNNWSSSSAAGNKRFAYKHDISDCEAMSLGEYF